MPENFTMAAFNIFLTVNIVNVKALRFRLNQFSEQENENVTNITDDHLYCHILRCVLGVSGSAHGLGGAGFFIQP